MTEIRCYEVKLPGGRVVDCLIADYQIEDGSQVELSWVQPCSRCGRLIGLGALAVPHHVATFEIECADGQVGVHHGSGIEP